MQISFLALAVVVVCALAGLVIWGLVVLVKRSR